MPALKTSVVDAALSVVSVHYMPRAIAKMLNGIPSTREDGITAFCGWYWIAKDGSAEGTGAKTRSAALMDAYCQLVRRQRRPAVAQAFAPPKTARKRTAARKAPGRPNLRIIPNERVAA